MVGIGISEGIAIGKAWMVEEPVLDFSEWVSQSPEKEMDVLRASLQRVGDRLVSESQKAKDKKQKERMEILEAHSIMLEDPELESQINRALLSGQKLPEAVRRVMEGFSEIMSAMEDPYLQQRSQDYLDLRNQVLKDLAGVSDNLSFEPGSSWIPVALDFSPSDIALAENPAVQGFICQGGAATTHFSILAKITGVPTVIQASGLLDSVSHGDVIIADGTTGEIHINPDPGLMGVYRKRKQDLLVFKESLEALKSEKTMTLDGAFCHLEGNITGPQGIPKMLENGAEGVGLFRTEFIYMDRATPPSEEEQADIYGEVLKGMDGRPVVIRTLDVGGDKELPYLGIEKEANPFLGFRAVRFCLTREDIFKTQLRALLRASVHGKLRIMVPMISGIEEVRSVKMLLDQCRAELLAQEVPMGEDIRLGIMIEVPSAAAMASLLAEEVDFFSIGTNDLIQYMMAADRMNQAVAYLYTPYHPAFLRTLEAIINGAHGAGIPAAMCGELAGDVDFIPVLVGLGLDIYSMNAGAILKARLRIRTLEQKGCRLLVEELMKLRTEKEIRAAVQAFRQEHPYETA